MLNPNAGPLRQPLIRSNGVCFFEPSPPRWCFKSIRRSNIKAIEMSIISFSRAFPIASLNNVAWNTGLKEFEAVSVPKIVGVRTLCPISTFMSLIARVRNGGVIPCSLSHNWSYPACTTVMVQSACTWPNPAGRHRNHRLLFFLYRFKHMLWIIPSLSALDYASKLSRRILLFYLSFLESLLPGCQDISLPAWPIKW